MLNCLNDTIPQEYVLQILQQKSMAASSLVDLAIDFKAQETK